MGHAALQLQRVDMGSSSMAWVIDQWVGRVLWQLMGHHMSG